MTRAPVHDDFDASVGLWPHGTLARVHAAHPDGRIAA